MEPSSRTPANLPIGCEALRCEVRFLTQHPCVTSNELFTVNMRTPLAAGGIRTALENTRHQWLSVKESK